MKYLLVAFLALGACSKSDKAGADTSAAAAKVGTIDVAALDQLLAADDCATFDANSQATRERQGVIPGATILTQPRDTGYGATEFSCRDPEGHVWSVSDYWGEP